MAPSSLLPLLPQMESPSLRMSSSLAVPTYSSPTPSPGTLVSMSAAPTSPSRGTSPRPPLSSACWVSRCAGGELRKGRWADGLLQRVILENEKRLGRTSSWEEP
jgi:hypothetical protein